MSVGPIQLQGITAARFQPVNRNSGRCSSFGRTTSPIIGLAPQAAQGQALLEAAEERFRFIAPLDGELASNLLDGFRLQTLPSQQ